MKLEKVASEDACLAIDSLPRGTRRREGTAVGRHASSLCYEIMRCHVLMGCTKMAAAKLPSALVAPSAERVALIGPLIAGLLGGCGGAFMPLSKGLEPLEKGTNWRIVSAAINSLWLLAATQYPPTKAALGLDEAWARFMAVAFFALFPIVQALTGVAPFGANPLAPIGKAKAKKS